MSHTATARRTRILVATPGADLRRDLTAHLEDAGYRVYADVEGSAHAAQILRTATLDAVVLDEVLLKAGGEALIAALGRQPAAAILLLASPDSPAIRRRVAPAGIDGVLSKPFDLASLPPAIEIALHLRRAETGLKDVVRRAERELATRELIAEAKQALMSRDGLSERAAYRRLQQRSMTSRMPMYRVAEAVLISQQAALGG